MNKLLNGNGWINTPTRFTKSGFLAAGQTAYNTGSGFFLGLDGATGQPRFSLGRGGTGLRLTWDGASLTLVASLTGRVESEGGGYVDFPAVLQHTASGAVAPGFGVGLSLQAQTGDGAGGPGPLAEAARLEAAWVDADQATRKSRLRLLAADAGGEREGMRIEASGSAPLLGFNGNAAIAKPVITGSRGGNQALANLLSALQQYGLITDATTP